MTSPRDCFGKDARLTKKKLTRNLTRTFSDPEEEEARPDLKDPSDTTDPEEEEARPELKDPSGTVITTADTRTERCEVRQVVRRFVRRECYSGFIIVRLTEKVALRAEGFPALCEKQPPEEPEPPRPRDPEPEPAAKDPDVECLKTLLRDCPPTLVVQAVTPAGIRRIERIAARTALPPLHSLASYWRVDARHLPERQVRAVVRLLNEFPEVDLAYREYAAFDPQAPSTPPDFEPLQQYLDRAPLGIDARWAWRQGGGAANAGAGVKVVDLEQGWFSHDDAPSEVFHLYGDNREGDNRRYRGEHGTAVLGQLVAQGNDFGVTGIASAAEAMTVSHYQSATRSNGHVADAVVAAVLGLRFGLDPGEIAGQDPTKEDLAERFAAGVEGHVLLIEVQRSYRPAEVDHADFDALRLAAALGVVVVEAAGNGGSDLDLYRDETRSYILDRDDPDFRDSGAILVGAGESRGDHDRSRFSNYGSRVDCYGWGDGVVTCGYGDLYDGQDRARTYTRRFRGTSSAAPIVAGAAVLVQWRHAQLTKARVTPAEMRRLLSDPANGTAQGARVTGKIGVMPDVRAVLESRSLAADLYSSAGPPEALSPRITTSRVPDGDPATRVDLRLVNASAAGVEVDAYLYGTDLSVLATPDMWRRERVVRGMNVPPWGAARSKGIDIPDRPRRLLPPGHYSFMTLLRAPGDPRPTLPPAVPPFFDWRGFFDFLRRYRTHLTVRVDAGATPVGPQSLPFLINGAPDRAREFGFEIRSPAPAVVLEVPVSLEDAFTGGAVARDGHAVFMGRPVTRFRLLAPRVVLPPTRLPAAGSWTASRGERRTGRYPCRFLVPGPKPGHVLILCQLFRGSEAGRIGWTF